MSVIKVFYLGIGIGILGDREDLFKVLDFRGYVFCWFRSMGLCRSVFEREKGYGSRVYVRIEKFRRLV